MQYVEVVDDDPLAPLHPEPAQEVERAIVVLARAFAIAALEPVPGEPHHRSGLERAVFHAECEPQASLELFARALGVAEGVVERAEVAVHGRDRRSFAARLFDRQRLGEMLARRFQISELEFALADGAMHRA